MSQLHYYKSRIETFALGMSRQRLLVLALALTGLILWLDINSGPFVSFGIFLILPIALCAWLLDRKTTYFIVLLSCIVRTYGFSDLFPANKLYLWIFNVLQSAVIFTVVEVLVWRIRQLNKRLVIHTTRIKKHADHALHKHRLEESIRRAIPEDADEIVRLLTLGIGEGAFNIELSPEKQKAIADRHKECIGDGTVVRDLWRGGLATVPAEFWVSVINGNIAAFMLVIALDEEIANERELHAVVVSDAYRGLGIGSALVDFFCTHYKKRQLFSICKPESTMMEMLKRRNFDHVVDNLRHPILHGKYYILSHQA